MNLSSNALSNPKPLDILTIGRELGIHPNRLLEVVFATTESLRPDPPRDCKLG
ncbi:hypothetical protein [Paenibacillus cremeus]|uniref:hypothetical protein n=1 Tax=Paenibacillus cremeus TaxID=2163881 RepID=UPI001648CF4C|nr:hypothetical protein [Paenibacillus cremeus]